MGLLDGFRAMVPPSEPVIERSEAEYDAWLTQLAADIASRQSSFTLSEALQLPPVIRGVSLIAGIGAAMLPLAYRNGSAMPTQPRIVRKPDPFGTRYSFLHQTLEAMVADRHGEAFWKLGDWDERGNPRTAMVLPNDEVQVTWDERRFLPRYHWRERELQRDREIKHIAPNRRPGELHGRGPIFEALDYLYPIKAAEDYASSFFSSGGLPMTVLQTQQALTKEQAAAMKAGWIEARDSGGAEPAVIGAGVDATFPATNPEQSQMTEARGAGAAVVARILGIPAALLHVETSGATITYTNPAGALDELVKSTVLPNYLTPIEQAWSELLPSTSAVRFDLGDLQRADVAGRFAVYGQAIGSGIMTAEEARAYEGWNQTNEETAHIYDPEPAEVTG